MIRHLPLALPAALVAGLAMGTRGVPLLVMVTAAVLTCCAAPWAWARGRPGVVVALLAVGCVGSGAAWSAVRVEATTPAPVRTSGWATGMVTVTGTPAIGPHGVRVAVQVTRMGGKAAPAPGTRLLLDLPPGASPPPVGVVARVEGRIAPASRTGSPPWWTAWLRRQGIAGRLRADGWRGVGWRGGPQGARDALRRWAQAHVAAGLSGDRAALVRGMALGGGEGLSDTAATRMRDAGLWHLLAVSGHNVAVIGIGVIAVLGAAGMPRTWRVATTGAAMLAYCLACDGGASVFRAGLMGAIGLAADLRGDRRAPWNALLVALAMMLVIDPLAVDDPGLQLSFAAVAGLFAIAPPLSHWLRGFMPGRAADLMAQSAGAGLATAPVLAAGFGSLSVVGLVSNLVAVPVAGPVVVVSMLGVVADAIWGPLGIAIAWVAAMGASLIMLVATVASAIPGAVQQVPGWGAVPLALLAAVPPMAWWWLRRVPGRGAVGRRWPVVHLPRGAAVSVAVVVLAAWPALRLASGCGRASPPQGVGLRMIDVGQGSAVALRNGSSVEVLVDAGPAGDPPPVITGLERVGASSVGVMVLSHGSADHAGGAMAVLDGMAVGHLVLPWDDRRAPLVRLLAREAASRGVPVTWAGAGTEVSTRAWTVRVIGPLPGAASSGDPNAHSLVVHAVATGVSALVPGDAESPVLAPLDLPRVDVLQVPHHGSEDPGLPAVLARLSPAAALVSAGAGNAFGHPRDRTLQALSRSGAQVLRTDRGGDVDVRPGNGGIVVSRG